MAPQLCKVEGIGHDILTMDAAPFACAPLSPPHPSSTPPPYLCGGFPEPRTKRLGGSRPDGHVKPTPALSRSLALCLSSQAASVTALQFNRHHNLRRTLGRAGFMTKGHPVALCPMLEQEVRETPLLS